MQLKTTPLHDEHQKLGARMVDFGGWHMPIQYTSISQEHEACRKAVALFDVSHMGEIRVRGENALNWLQTMVTNNLEKIKDGQAQYNVLCYENGGCVDDIIVYRLAYNDLFICVNASNTDKDFEWLKQHQPPGVTVTNESAEWGQIAVQGPQAQALCERVCGITLGDMKYYHFTQATIQGSPAIIARTGYTGEDGFELYVAREKTASIWNLLLTEGKSYGVLPAGLAARDTLRTEMKFALYGHEISETLNPIEAGLAWVVKFDKGPFIGADALQKIKASPTRRHLVGLKTTGRGIPRQGYNVYAEMNATNAVGTITSGTLSPSLKHGIAIAYVDHAVAKIGTRVFVKIRDEFVEHIVTETPFYKRQKLL